MITHTGGLYHTPVGSYQDQHERETLKALGFRFHWGRKKTRGDPKGCNNTCVACEKHLPSKVWWTASHVAAKRFRLDAKAREAMEAAYANEQSSRAEDSTFEAPAPPGLVYYPFQRAAIAYAYRRKRVLFGDAMGIGKTIEAIGWINAVSEDWPRCPSVLVVCPSSLKHNWKLEMRKWLVRPSEPLVIDEQVTSTERPPDHVIVNYERISGDRQQRNLDWLLSRDWDFLLIDEAHKIKNRQTHRAKALLGYRSDVGLIERAGRIAMLTGTPIPNRPKELLPLLDCLAPGMIQPWDFLRRYCGAEQVTFYKKNAQGVAEEHTAWKFDGASNLQELQAMLRSSIMIRRLKRDVLTELPEKTRQLIPIPREMGGSALQALDDAIVFAQRMAQLRADAILAEGDEDAYETAVVALRQAEDLELANMAAERRDIGLAKLPFANDYLQELLDGSDHKLVVFGHHQAVLERLSDRFDGESVLLYGPTPAAARAQAIERFNEDPAVRLFIGSIGAAGVGLTLTASSHVVFVEGSWVPADEEQAEDRVHRIGQRRAVLIQRLVFDDSIDAYMAERVVQKREVLKGALDASQKKRPVTEEEICEARRILSDLGSMDIKQHHRIAVSRLTEMTLEARQVAIVRRIGALYNVR